MQRTMETVAQRIVGENCTLDKPVRQPDGSYVGGTAFERSDRAVPVPGTSRAFTLGPSYERVPNTSAPHASGKIYRGEWDEHLELQRDIVAVSIADCFCWYDLSLCYCDCSFNFRCMLRRP